MKSVTFVFLILVIIFFAVGCICGEFRIYTHLCSLCIDVIDLAVVFAKAVCFGGVKTAAVLSGGA